MLLVLSAGLARKAFKFREDFRCPVKPRAGKGTETELYNFPFIISCKFIRYPDVITLEVALGAESIGAPEDSAYAQLVVERMYVGPFMTSLDMAGFSLTLMRLDDRLLAALDAPTQAWRAAQDPWGLIHTRASFPPLI